MTAHATRPASPPASLTEWLRRRSDEQLAELLRRRPDLSLPTPADLATLASRIGVRSSVQRAVDSLDAFTLRVLEAVVLDLLDELDGLDVDVGPALDELRRLALLWGDDDRLHVVAGVPDALGPYPAGLGRPAGELPHATLDPERIGELIAGCDPAEREVLDRLAAGPPIGLVRDALLSADLAGNTPPHRLITRGLLVPIDAQTVELPREVGLALRGETPLGPLTPQPPELAVVERDVDRQGSTAVLDVLRQVAALGDAWSAHPPAVLRSGGLGARELRRTARELDVTEPVAALLIEVAAAAGLLATTHGIEPVFLPTPEFDAWRRREPSARWAPLATAWLAMTRQPSLSGRRDERDRLITPLGPDGERGTAPVLRRQVLAVLADLPPGSAPLDRNQVLSRLAWRMPRRASAQRQAAEAVLDEAQTLGVAAGGLTGYGRAVLAGSSDEAEAALRAALPEPVDYFLVQPDLTVVVPGPPAPDLAEELTLVADLESTGGASVYRITESSVRRALDAGRTGTDLDRLFAERSRTPVPQALDYLVADVSRRHGLLRAGPATAYLRCDDPALLDRVLADRTVAAVDLVRIAPTVVVSTATVARLLEVLREAGYAPSAEAADGAVVALPSDAPRAPSRPTSRLARSRPGVEPAHLAELIRRMRAGDQRSELARRAQPIGQRVPGVTTAATMGLLRDAIRAGDTEWLHYVDSAGRAAEVYVQPISMAAGVLRGHDARTGRLEAYPLHHITAVSVVDE